MKALAALTGACGIAAAIVIGFGSDARAQGGCVEGDTLVAIRGSAFSPNSVTVAPGSTVCWTNEDPFEHTVTSTLPGFDSGPLDLSATFRHTFATAGTFAYYCAVPGHNMPGTVVVGASQPPPPPPPPPSPPPPPPPSPPPPPAGTRATQSVSGVRMRIARSDGRRWLVARAGVTVAAPARLQLLRRNRGVASARKRFRPGRNELRLLVRRSLPRGTYVARLTIGGAARPYTARIPIG
jgi:plastocyanin